MGDRAEVPRRRPPVPGDLRAELGPRPAGRVPAHHRQPDPPRLGAAAARGRARDGDRDGPCPGGGRDGAGHPGRSRGHRGPGRARWADRGHRSGGRQSRTGRSAPGRFPSGAWRGAAGPGSRPGGRPAARRAQLPARTGRRLAARRRTARRARPAAACAVVAAGVRPPDRRAGRARGAGRGRAAIWRPGAVGPAAGYRAAVPVARARPLRRDPADGVRRSSQPGQPRPLGRSCGPASPEAVDRGGRRPGLAAACRRAGPDTRGGGRGGGRPVPRPGLHRHRPRRTGTGSTWRPRAG